MKKSPGQIIFLLSRAAIGLCALFRGVNLLFVALGSERMMPMALSMTGYLAKVGSTLSSNSGNVFYGCYTLALAGIACAALLLCAVLSGRSTGWLTAGSIFFLADCAGIGMLILHNGYRSGYWFELAGHAVMLVFFAAAFCSLPKKPAGKAA